MEYRDIATELFQSFAGRARILIVTATNVETVAVHSRLKAPIGDSVVMRCQSGAHTYFIGSLGAYLVIHTQCEMGGGSSRGSMITAVTAIDLWDPAAIIMPGIAFGIDPTSQSIGDILVSKSVRPYDSRKVSSSGDVPRGTPLTAGNILVDRFSNQTAWTHYADGNRAKIIPADLLSGETLVDDLDFRNSLVKSHPTVRGGEMEGAGLSAACESKNREWIIAKGICDFADGNKSANKDVRQKVAADSSVDLLCHVLSSEFALKDLGCLPEVATSSRGHQSLSTEELKKIYFDQYGSECEPYYLCRDHDRYLAERASFYSLWLYGPPGCGKTASIRRCLAQSDKDFTYVSLATCANYDDRELLAYLCGELSLLLTGAWWKCPTDFGVPDLITTIVAIISESFLSKKGVIYFDEIPADSSESFGRFVKNLLGALVKLFGGTTLSNCSFIFSSINSPVEHIPKSHHQVYERIKFVETPLWAPKEIDDFVSMLVESSRISLKPEDRIQIVKTARGCPRTVKSVLRDLTLMGTKIPLSQVLNDFHPRWNCDSK